MAFEKGISVTSVDVNQLIENLNSVGRKQIPFALSRAVNKLAQKVQKAQKAEALRVFDRPTRWTMNATYVKHSRKTDRDPIAEVGWRYWGSDGTPASKYLIRHVDGIARTHTAFENRLISTGKLYSDQFLVAGKFESKNEYGNLSEGTYMKILSDTKSQYDARNNRTAKTKAKSAYFAIRQPRGKLKPGIYKRTEPRLKVQPVFVATSRAPHYKKTYDFYGIGNTIIARDFGTELESALEYAIETAK